MTEHSWTRMTAGQAMPAVCPGDFILCHRRGLVSAIIRMGERIRFRSGARWSHAAFVDDWAGAEPQLIEALTRGVVRTPLDAYRDVEYVVVHTRLAKPDRDQAVRFAQSCLGQHYGWSTIARIALRFLTPGRGGYGGLNGTEICSGLVAQAQVRGWINYPVNPASMSPAELAQAHGVPDRRSR